METTLRLVSMGQLGVRVLVPGEIGAVYRKVTALDASGSPDEAAMAQKYGRLIQKMDDVYLFEEDRPERLQWRVTFQPPSRRSMEAVDPKWSDRVDTFAETRAGTQWTMTWHTRTRGLTSVLQWMLFQVSGKRRVMREIVAPVMAEFSGSHRGRQA